MEQRKPAWKVNVKKKLVRWKQNSELKSTMKQDEILTKEKEET